jgi:hypothetical protein
MSGDLAPLTPGAITAACLRPSGGGASMRLAMNSEGRKWITIAFWAW